MSNWFCKLGGAVSGPFTLDELIFLRDREKLSSEDLLRDGPSGDWILAANVALLFPPHASAAAASEKRIASARSKRHAEKKAGHAADSASSTSTALLDEPARADPPDEDSALRPPPLPSKDKERRRQVLMGVGIGILVILLLLLLLWLLLSFAGVLGTGGGGGGGSGGGEGAGSGFGSGAGSGGGAANGEGRGAKGSSSRPAVADNSPKVDQAGDSSSSRDDAATRERLPNPDPSSNALVALKPEQSVPPQEAGGDAGRIGGGGSGGGGGGTDGNSFFGVKSKGRKFVYVVDCSSSMHGSRFAKACEELKASIARLKPHQNFYVYFFNHGTHSMPDAEKLLRASPENVAKAHQWIDQMNENGGTDPEDAMLHALELKPDAIFMLTDGGFRRTTADVIRQKNNRRTSINTICFEDQSGEPQMQQIARENRGDYRFVP